MQRKLAFSLFLNHPLEYSGIDSIFLCLHASFLNSSKSLNITTFDLINLSCLNIRLNNSNFSKVFSIIALERI